MTPDTQTGAGPKCWADIGWGERVSLWWSCGKNRWHWSAWRVWEWFGPSDGCCCAWCCCYCRSLYLGESEESNGY